MRRDLLYSLEILEKYCPKYNLVQSEVGIITAGDSNVFDGIQILFASIKNKINFLCYDIGFTKTQKAWAKKNKMSIVPYLIEEDIKTIDKWQTFMKPWFVQESPFEYTIWIDSDCIVIGDLTKSSLISNQQTFFTQHWILQNMLKKNNNQLYELYPVSQQEIPYINAGVFAINKTKNQNIIESWKTLILDCFKNTKLFKLLANWDEGALNWSLQKNEAKNYIHDCYTHNCFSDFAQNYNSKLKDTYHQNTILYEGTAAFPNVFFRKILQFQEPLILHFSTCMNNKKKYWNLWD